VKEWLEDMLQQRLPGPFSQFSAVYWAKPSLKSLASSFEGATEISFIVPRLGLADDHDEIHRKWLLAMIESGVIVNVYVRQTPAESGILNSSDSRSALRHLYPYLQSGRLKVFTLPDINADAIAELPRVWADNLDASTAYFTGSAGVGLFTNPLPEPVFRSPSGSLNAQAIQALQDAPQLPIEAFESWMPLKRWELSAKDADRFNLVFGHLSDAHIQSVRILDPFCAASEQNRKSLRQFITSIVDIASIVERVTITAREIFDQDERWKPFHEVQKELESALSDLDVKCDVDVRQFKKARQFHDRTIDIVMIDDTGVSTKYRYDLTGGIDHVMMKGRDTKVYRYEV